MGERVTAPVRLAQSGNRVLRPRDFTDFYANPSPEFARMTRAGVLMRIAHGYYVLVPDQFRGMPWKPQLEAVALGIAVADYGREGAAVMGPSAARLLGVIPRALATATIAIPRQRPALDTTLGLVRFVTRAVDTLDRERVTTEVVQGWTTSAEQTALDLADRPTLGGITVSTASEAIQSLARTIDLASVDRLATGQRKRAAHQRLTWVAGLEPPDRLRRDVPSLGLVNPTADPVRYGIERVES